MRTSVLILGLLAAVGCRIMPPPWGDRPIPLEEAASTGDDSRATTSTLAIEVTFLRQTPHGGDSLRGLWDLVDEQALDGALRQRLAANGLRGGVITGGMPAELTERLAEALPETLAMESIGSRQILRLFPGRRAELVAAARRPELIILEEDDLGVHGSTFRDASVLVVLRAWPAADGRVRIETVPELRHGPMQRSWIGEEGMFRMENAQARHRLDQLAIDVTLPVAGLLVVADAGDAPSTVGEALLREGDRAGTRLMLIRPLMATTDPLFAGTADVRGGSGTDKSGNLGPF
jgi:hypothetical protein